MSATETGLLATARGDARPTSNRPTGQQRSLPDMDYCRCMGWVLPAVVVVAPYGYTQRGLIRKTRRGTLSRKKYMQEFRARRFAAGLTARGTARKTRVRKTIQSLLTSAATTK